MRRTTTRVAVLTIAGLTVGMTAALAPTTAGAAASAHRTVKNTGRGFITKVEYPNGDVSQVYSATPVTMSSDSGNTALATTTTASGRTLHSASGQAVPDLSKVPVVNGKPQLLPTPSAYDELIALGAPAEVAAQFKQLDTGITAAPASTATADSANVVAASGTIIDGNNCTSQSSDGGRIKMYGCDTTTRVATSGSIWYLEDDFLSTGTAHDTAIFNPDELTGLRFGVQYGSGNQITHWNPASTMSMGNCQQNTVSVTYMAVTVSNTTTECPETFGVKDINATLFTAKWDGQGSGPSNASRESHGVDSVYNGASASPYPTLVWTYWWA